MLDDHVLAREMALAAGQLLRRLREDSWAMDDRSLGRTGDAQANVLLLQMLQEHRPQDAFLSEETAPDPARLNARRVWIIDPLDGTREYSESSATKARDRSDWAVHVALCENGMPVAGAVALPAQEVCYGTADPVLGSLAAQAQTRALQAAAAQAANKPLRIAVSRSRAPALADTVAKALGAELFPMGSAGAKAMAVLQGRADAYLHAGGLSEWDACAPVAVALAAGLHASRIDGQACRYNQANPSQPDLLVCAPALAPPLLRAISEAR